MKVKSSLLALPLVAVSCLNGLLGQQLSSLPPQVVHYADLVVLGDDYMTVPEVQISEVPIDLTIVGAWWSMIGKKKGKSALITGNSGIWRALVS